MRTDSLVRCLRLAHDVAGRRYVVSLPALAAIYGVCPRTIRRDLEALEAAGWRVPRWRQRERRDAEECA